ncbi:MAG: hypothetical protein U5N26_08130 [Candidatus Marinimicrobia bacterium]|nr:hypothetical protein [Candidatus Neomarinimicrobiota bacterium]
MKNLVREHQGAGVYRVDFDAGRLPSGIYIARLQTERGVMNRKCSW